MRKILAISAMLFFCSCGGRSPVQGWIYTGVQSGLAVSAQAGPKTGEACATSILGIIATGDASSNPAAVTAVNLMSCPGPVPLVDR